MANKARYPIYFVILGDSYSVSAEYDVDEDERPDSYTWVDFIPELLDIHAENIQNFSLPGATAEEDLGEQLARFSRINQDRTELALNSATYVLFFGINDCGQNTADRLAPIVDKIIEAARTLVTQFGGRNFVFVDVPPTDRAPAAVQMECGDTVRGRVSAWNHHLRAKVAEWAAETQSMAEKTVTQSRAEDIPPRAAEKTQSRAKETQSRAGKTQSRATEGMHARATQGTHARTAEPQKKTHLFSSHEVITDILDDPEKYGFSREDVGKEGGEIWVDDLHLSSAVHRIWAERFVKCIELLPRSG